MEHFEKAESNPQAPISQMAKLRLREAGCLAHSQGASGAGFFRPLLAQLWSLCGVGSCVHSLWAGRGWRMCSESGGGARGAGVGPRGRRDHSGLLLGAQGNKHSFLASWALSLLIPPPSPPLC